MQEPLATNAFAHRALRAAQLYMIAARSVCYPSRQAARWLVTQEYPRTVVSLVQSLGCTLDVPCGFKQSSCGDAELEGAVTELRREYTRLLYRPMSSIPLVGARWLQDQTLISWKMGEAYAVRAEYASLGFGGTNACNVPADHLVNELEYACHVYRLEYAAWQAGDFGRTEELKRQRMIFTQFHLGDLARGVGEACRDRSDNPTIALLANLLILLSDPHAL